MFFRTHLPYQLFQLNFLNSIIINLRDTSIMFCRIKGIPQLSFIRYWLLHFFILIFRWIIKFLKSYIFIVFVMPFLLFFFSFWFLNNFYNFCFRTFLLLLFSFSSFINLIIIFFPSFIINSFFIFSGWRWFIVVNKIFIYDFSFFKPFFFFLVYNNYFLIRHLHHPHLHHFDN